MKVLPPPRHIQLEPLVASCSIPSLPIYRNRLLSLLIRVEEGAGEGEDPGELAGREEGRDAKVAEAEVAQSEMESLRCCFASWRRGRRGGGGEGRGVAAR